MPQYLLSVHHAWDRPMPPQEEMEAAFAAVDVFNQELMDTGAFVFAGGLQPPSSATVIRVTDGEAVLTDGPFAETKEQLGGFWVVEAADLDVALELGRKGALACREVVEVRPFQVEPPA